MRGFARAPETLVGAYQNHGDIIRPTGLVGGVHQPAHGGVRVGAVRRQQVFDLRVREHVVEPVGAQQVEVARLGGVGAHGYLDPRIHAERAGHEILADRLPGLLRRKQSAIEELLDHGMVLGQEFEPAVPQPVKPGVANVGHAQRVVLKQRGHDRGAHPGAFWIVVRHLVDGGIGGLDGAVQGVPFVAARFGIMTSGRIGFGSQSVDTMANHDIHSQVTGDLAGVMSAHAVCQHDQPDFGAQDDMILVLGGAGARDR